MQNPRNTFADITGQVAIFLGENVHRHFMFGNGAPIATHLFTTLPEAVTRFGRRIVTNNKIYAHSQPYKDGIAAAASNQPYAPVRAHGKQAVLEYGTGYLRGLIEAMPAESAKDKALTEAEHNALSRKASGAWK